MKALPGQFSLVSLCIVIVVFILMNLIISFRIIKSVRSDIKARKNKSDTTLAIVVKNESDLKLLTNKITSLNKEVILLHTKLHNNDSSIANIKKEMLKIKATHR